MLYPLVIVNITPDSFSDGGLYNSVSRFKAKVLGDIEKGFTRFDIVHLKALPLEKLVLIIVKKLLVLRPFYVKPWGIQLY